MKFNINLNIAVALFLIMFTAKVFGVVTWSWWIISLPILIPSTILLTCLLIVGSVMLLAKIFDRHI